MTQKKSLKEMIAELESYSLEIDNDDNSLEDSIGYYKKAHAMIKDCKKILKESKLLLESHNDEDEDVFLK